MYCIRNINIAIDYHGAGIMLVYNGKGDKCDCCNLLSVIGKQYGRVHIKRFSAGTACALEMNVGLDRVEGCSCVETVFAVRQVCEKYLTN